MSTPESAHVPVIPPPRFFFAVSLAAFCFFLLWSWLVFGTDLIQPIDDACVEHWREWTKNHRDITLIMIFWTEMGGIAGMTILSIMGAIWQSAINHRVLAVAWLAIALGGGMINGTVKEIFARHRPPAEQRDPVAHEENASYPSGHSMGSAIGYGTLAYALVLPQRHRPRRAAAIALMIGIVLMVGFSRMFLRAHWFSDVIAGWTSGVCWLFFCLGWLERHRRGQL
jgi:membrane-associated phospholipid phosphatase